jgi:hypothetical protein
LSSPRAAIHVLAVMIRQRRPVQPRVGRTAKLPDGRESTGRRTDEPRVPDPEPRKPSRYLPAR